MVVVLAGRQLVKFILTVLSHLVAGQQLRCHWSSQSLCCAAWDSSHMCSSGVGSGFIPVRHRRGDHLLQDSPHTLWLARAHFPASRQRDSALVEFKIPVLLPHNSVWSGLPLGKVEREKREKITDFPHTHIHFLGYKGPFFFWFFWVETLPLRVLAPCGVTTVFCDWGHLGGGSGLTRNSYGK